MNISAHEVSELLFHPANFDNDDGTETEGGMPDIKQVSFYFQYHTPNNKWFLFSLPTGLEII